MRHEYAVHAGVYEDTWHDYETHKRRKIFESKEEAKEWAAQVKADWVRNNFFALKKY